MKNVQSFNHDYWYFFWFSFSLLIFLIPISFLICHKMFKNHYPVPSSPLQIAIHTTCKMLRWLKQKCCLVLPCSAIITLKCVCVRNAEVVERYKDSSLYTPNSNQPKHTHICHQAKEPATKIALYIEYVLTYNSSHRRLFRAKDWIKIYPF